MAQKTRKTTEYAYYTVVRHYTDGENNVGDPIVRMQEVGIFTEEAKATAYIAAADANEDDESTYETRETWYDKVLTEEDISLPINPDYQPEGAAIED